MAKIIQLATYKFCKRYFNRCNDPDGKEFVQTTGSARAVPANIAEGSARHQTSVESEMTLLDVARGSLSELLDDLMFVLMVNDLPVWCDDDDRAVAIREFRLTTPTYGKSLLHDVNEHVMQNYKSLQPWLENDDLETCVNTLIILCTRVVSMLRNQLEKRLDQFAQEGGFRENMTDTRIQARNQQAIDDGAPLCPKCGAVMVKRLVKAEINSGRQFWGCSAWRNIGCQGKIYI